jgi:hypothetical protein
LVVFQGQNSNGTSTIPPELEAMTNEAEPTVIEDDEAISLNEPDSSDEHNDDMYQIEHDPGLRIPISSYNVNDQDSVRRAYIALGQCRPKMKQNDFPQHECGGMHQFNRKWFTEFKWLEYSGEKDAAYCFVCYLFKDSNKFSRGDKFIDEGFRNWHMKSRIHRHAGVVNSAHSEAQEKYNLFMKPKASVRESIASYTTELKAQYLACLKWSLQGARYLLRQGLAFRGHDESLDSLNKGNF